LRAYGSIAIIEHNTILEKYISVKVKIYAIFRAVDTNDYKGQALFIFSVPAKEGATV